MSNPVIRPYANQKQLHEGTERIRPVAKAIVDTGIISAALMFGGDEGEEYGLVIGWAALPKEQALRLNAEMMALIHRYDPKLKIAPPEKIQ